jgi:class 3 adenylate cyclase
MATTRARGRSVVSAKRNLNIERERAVRASLGLIEAVGGLKSPVPLQTRVGIATGLVVTNHKIAMASLPFA